MKLLEFITLLFLAVSIRTCINNKKQNEKIVDDYTIRDSSKNANSSGEEIQHALELFSGEYLIGDGDSFIVPVGDTYEMQNSNGEKTDILYFDGKENDTIEVYSNNDRSIISKMNPGHKVGMYYQPDEQWPVHYKGPIKQRKSEEEEIERILKQRHFEDSITYTELGIYNGDYLIYTEIEGVNSTLKLLYNGDQTFNYEWNFNVSKDEVICVVKMNGIVTMDRTQHGFDSQGDCFIHFNFNGSWSEGDVVEIDFEDQTKCMSIKGDCIFSGRYIKKRSK